MVKKINIGQATFYVPTLNSERTLELCLNGVLESVQKKSINLVDSGSKDNTLKIAKKFKLRVLKSTNLANGRNVALRDCRTKLIAFIDSDVVISKNWLSEITLALKDDVAGACGKMQEKNVSTLPDKWRAFHLKQSFSLNPVEPKFIFGSNSIYITEALRKAGGFDEVFKTNYEDVDISKKLISKGYRISYVPSARCFHLKKDTFFSVLKMARKWSFHSYPKPDSFARLLMRILIYNSHYFLMALKKDDCRVLFHASRRIQAPPLQ